MILSEGVSCACGGFFIHLVLGTLYCWGNITTAVTAYIRGFDPSVTYSDTLAVYSAALAFQGLFMSIGGFIERQIGARKTVMLGGYIIVFGTFLAARATSLIELVFANGVLFGIGMGIAYSSPITAAARWLPKRKSLLSGVIVSGFGGGAFLFGFIATAIVNPYGVSIADSGADGYYNPNSYVPQHVPQMYTTFGVIFFILISIGAYLIKDTTETHYEPLHDTTVPSPSVENPRTHLYQKMAGVDTVSDKSTVISSSSSPTPVVAADLQPMEFLQSSRAWHLAACLVLTAAPGMFLAGTYKVFGEQYIQDESFLSTIGSVSAVFNSCGRILAGALADRFGALPTLTAFILVQVLVVVTYPASATYLGKAGFGLWTLLMFGLEGTNFALYPPLNVQYFGSKNASINYGLMFSVYSLFTVLNITFLAEEHVEFIMATRFLAAVLLLGVLSLVLFALRVR